MLISILQIISVPPKWRILTVESTIRDLVTMRCRRSMNHQEKLEIAILVVLSTWLAVSPIIYSNVFASLTEFKKLYTAWFTVNGQRYGDLEYDMSDALWNDDAEPHEINTEPFEEILVLPHALQYKICLENDDGYQSCQTVSNLGNRPEEINFVYPSGTVSIMENSKTAGDIITEDQDNRYYEGLDWQGICNNTLVRNYISQLCNILVTSDGNALTSQGKQSMENLLCPRGPSILSTIELFYGYIPSNLKNELASACGWE